MPAFNIHFPPTKRNRDAVEPVLVAWAADTVELATMLQADLLTSHDALDGSRVAVIVGAERLVAGVWHAAALRTVLSDWSPWID